MRGVSVERACEFRYRGATKNVFVIYIGDIGGRHWEFTASAFWAD